MGLNKSKNSESHTQASMPLRREAPLLRSEISSPLKRPGNLPCARSCWRNSAGLDSLVYKGFPEPEPKGASCPAIGARSTATGQSRDAVCCPALDPC